MRRFWAFFTLLFSVLLAVGLISQPILESADVSNEFTSGSVIQYEVALPEDSSETSLRDIDVAGEINERLDTAGIRGASVELYWPDDSFMQETATVRISFPTQSQSELASFRRILEGTGPLTVTSTNTAADEIMTGSEFFSDPVASVEYDENNAPYVALHVKDAETFQTMVDRASAEDDANSSGEDGEDSTTKLYIWRNFDPETDSYDAAFSDDEDVYDALVADKLLFVIDTSMWNSDTLTINIAQDNGWDISSSRVPWNGQGTAQAWDITSARAMVASINAADYSFDIQYTFTSTSPATLGESALLWAGLSFGLAFLVIAVGLIVRFRAAGVMSAVTSAVGVLVTLFIGTALGFEISSAAFVGLAITAVISILCNVNYFTRVYSELRKGRDVFKADREGYHKSFVGTVDICVSALFISLFSFLIGRDLTKVAFGFVLIGSVVAFLIGNYLTKWLIYWMTSAWHQASPKAMFGFTSRDAKQVEPLYDANAQQPQLAEKQPSKLTRGQKAKIGAWTGVTAGLTAACALVLGILGGLNGTDALFNNSGTYEPTFTVSLSTLGNAYTDSDTGRDIDFTDGQSFTDYIRNEVIEPALDSFSVGDDNIHFATVDEFLEGTGLSLDQMEFNMVEVTNDSGEDDDTFVVLYASYSMPVLSGDLAQYRTEALTTVIEPGVARLSDATVNSAAGSNIAVGENFTNEDLGARYQPTFTYGESEAAYRDHATDFMFIGLACMVAFVAIYAGLRYGLAVGITQLVISLLGAVLGLVPFALLRLPFTAAVGYGLLGGTMISGLALLPFLSRNRDILRERRAYRTAKLGERFQAAEAANLLTWPVLVFGVVSAVLFGILGLGLYGTSSAAGMGLAFGLSGAGSLLAGGLIAPTLYPPLRIKLSFKTWSERLAASRAKRGKNRKVIVADPNEAHETVIPGINDYRSL